jgi:hypothetical protein
MANTWEWRNFSWTVDGDLEQTAATLSERISGKKVKDIGVEQDVYLVVPGVDHNVKVRDADLELKLKIDIKTDGCVRWQEKLQWTFPLEGEQTAALWAWLLSSQTPPPRIVSAEDLVARLRAHAPLLGLVSVDKRRASFKCDNTKVEVGDITLAGAQSLRTICIEGDTLDDVRATLKKTGLALGGAVFSYVELLQTALLWVPSARSAARVAEK